MKRCLDPPTMPNTLNLERAQVIGKEKTHWEVRRSSGKTSHTDHYNGKADVIKVSGRALIHTSVQRRPADTPLLIASATMRSLLVGRVPRPPPAPRRAAPRPTTPAHQPTRTPPTKRARPQAVLPLMQGPGTLNPGGHRFPFSFSLPDGLPPSFEYKCGSTRASIAYKVKVMVDQVRRV